METLYVLGEIGLNINVLETTVGDCLWGLPHCSCKWGTILHFATILTSIRIQLSTLKFLKWFRIMIPLPTTCHLLINYFPVRIFVMSPSQILWSIIEWSSSIASQLCSHFMINYMYIECSANIAKLPHILWSITYAYIRSHSHINSGQLILTSHLVTYHSFYNQVFWSILKRYSNIRFIFRIIMLLYL